MRISSAAGTLGRHLAWAVIEAGLFVAALIALIFAASVFVNRAPAADAALAAPGSSSVWVTTGDGTSRSAATAEVAFGAAFVVDYATRERKPWALVMCYPNDTTVYTTTFSDRDGHEGYVWGEYFTVYEGGPVPQNFILGDGYANWTGGGADCTVELIKFSSDGRRSSVLARSEFTGVP